MKAIVFDIDGTLTDTKKVDDVSFKVAFKKTFGVAIDGEEWDNLQNVTDWGITEELVQKYFNREPGVPEYELMLFNFMKELNAEKLKDPNQFKEVKGATDFLYHLKQKPYWKIGIATGAWEKPALFKLGAAGISIEGFAFANSTRFKSRAEITRSVISQLSSQTNTLQSEIVYFGDGTWDYQTCKHLNIKFIGIDIRNDNKLKGLGAEFVFENYQNITKMMEVIMA